MRKLEAVFSLVLFCTVPPALAADGKPEEKPCTKGLEQCVAEKRQQFQERGTLGMQIRPTEDTAARAGWQICQLLDAGSAVEAGIEPDDIIVEWDGQSTATIDEKVMENRLQSIKIGDEVDLTILREDKTHAVTLVAARPTPALIEAWLLTYVYDNFSEVEFQAYELRMTERISADTPLPDN